MITASESQDLVRLYLSEIGREPLLSRDEEESLARAMEEGKRAAATLLDGRNALGEADRRCLELAVVEGERARQRFVRANLRLVVSVARRWTRSGMPLLDLIQEGNVGLMRAVDGFDYRLGFRFSTYASWWIRQAITRAIANTGRLVRLPVHTGNALNQLLQEIGQLEGSLGTTPSVESLALATGIPAPKVVKLLQLSHRPVSIFEPVGDDGDELGSLLADVTAASPGEAALASVLPTEVARLLDRLDSGDREIVSLRFGFVGGEPSSLEGIADILGLSQSEVRQRLSRALRVLRRAASASPGLRDLLAA